MISNLRIVLSILLLCQKCDTARFETVAVNLLLKDVTLEEHERLLADNPLCIRLLAMMNLFSYALRRIILVCVDIPVSGENQTAINMVQFYLVQRTYRLATTEKAWETYWVADIIPNFNSWLVQLRSDSEISFSEMDFVDIGIRAIQIFEFEVAVSGVPSKQRNLEHLSPWTRKLLFSYFKRNSVHVSVLKFIVLDGSEAVFSNTFTLNVRVMFDYSSMAQGSLWLSDSNVVGWFSRSLINYRLPEPDPTNSWDRTITVKDNAVIDEYIPKIFKQAPYVDNCTEQSVEVVSFVITQLLSFDASAIMTNNRKEMVTKLEEVFQSVLNQMTNDKRIRSAALVSVSDYYRSYRAVVKLYLDEELVFTVDQIRSAEKAGEVPNWPNRFHNQLNITKVVLKDTFLQSHLMCSTAISEKWFKRSISARTRLSLIWIVTVTIMRCMLNC